MATINPDVCRDAVIVLPGIMGSELVEIATGTVLWGLSDLNWYVKAWTTGASLHALSVTDNERNGRTGRVRASRILRVPAFAPMLRGFEPYGELLTTVRRFVADAAALREFAYDWRLSIDYNATELAKTADEHLSAWRRHPKGSRCAQLVLVAHSMGGLVARYFTGVLGGATDVRATVTLGTPFYGAVKAVVMLSAGRGAPLPVPQRRLRRLVRTMPGLHDLLPSYRCVDEGSTARRLTADDISALGGDRSLAQEAFYRREKLLAAGSEKLHAVVGVQQPTMQSVRITGGVAEPLFYSCFDALDGTLERKDRRGDETVCRDAAAPAGVDPLHMPQSHAALANSEAAIAQTCAVLTGTKLGPPLGQGNFGIQIPDVVNAQEEFELNVLDVEDPAAVTCDVEQVNQSGSRFINQPYFGPLAGHEPMLTARVTLPQSGLYRVAVKSGATSAISQLILAINPDEPLDAADMAWINQGD